MAESSYLSIIPARRDPSSSWYCGQRLRLAIMTSEVRVQHLMSLNKGETRRVALLGGSRNLIFAIRYS